MQNSQMNPRDIASLLNKIQEQLSSLERKVDALANRSSPARPPETHAPLLHKQEKSNRNRQMFKAICADCNKDCEVPFRPSGDRPVYCNECFARRKAGTPPKLQADSRVKVITPAPVITSIDWRNEGEKKKPAAGKKAVKKPLKKQKKKGAR